MGQAVPFHQRDGTAAEEGPDDGVGVGVELVTDCRQRGSKQIAGDDALAQVHVAQRANEAHYCA